MNATISFRPGKREQVPLLIGLVGPSGSGKTYSALRLAKGIQSVAGGKIAVIDTEARRALHYADRFQFEYAEFQAPFGARRYAEALTAAVALGARTIVVDSTSHEHEGPGGHLAMHEAELATMVGRAQENDQRTPDWKLRDRYNFSAWIKPAGDRRYLINTILQLNANFIFCFRAKEKLALVKDDKGKTVPVPMGWQAIAGDEFVYEQTVRCLLPPGSNGVPDWTEETMKLGVPKLCEEHRAILPTGQQLTEDVGKRLAEWAKGNTVTAEESAGATVSDNPLLTRAKAASESGVASWSTFWNNLNKDERLVIASQRAALRKRAEEVDLAGSDEEPPPHVDPVTGEVRAGVAAE